MTNNKVHLQKCICVRKRQEYAAMTLEFI